MCATPFALSAVAEFCGPAESTTEQFGTKEFCISPPFLYPHSFVWHGHSHNQRTADYWITRILETPKPPHGRKGRAGFSETAAGGKDRGRNEGLTSPLPPNRTGGFPASGFPVSGLFSEVGALAIRLKLRRSIQDARSRHRSSASIDSSCEASQHAFDPHFRCDPLPCLANGTRGSLCCSCASLMRPPSYPPWLHGHYSLHRYYEDSDSCPAPSSTRTGILDS